MKTIFAALIIFSAFTPAARSYQIDELLAAINKNNVSSVEETLAVLPENVRRSFVLMRDSRSLQQASPDHPRAILFGDDGRFVLTFNGEPNQSGYNTLEIYQVNEQTSKFEFYRLEYPLVRGENGRVATPLKNPAQCLKCHGQDPKPLWSSYPIWPGAYGQRDDLLSTVEKEPYARFRLNLPNHARYSKLVFFDSSIPHAPYRKDYLEKNYQNRPGDRFSSLVIRWNTRRVASMVKSSENYQKHLPLLMYTMNGCKRPDQPIPEWNWTQEDVDILKKTFPKLDDESVVRSFGTEVSDYDLTTLGEPPMGLDYHDGTLLGDARTFLMGALMGDFLATRPGLSSLVLWYPDGAYGGGIIIKTEFDKLVSGILDSQSIAARFRLKTCPLLLDEVRKLGL
jgi:hypothetical protein